MRVRVPLGPLRRAAGDPLDHPLDDEVAIHDRDMGAYPDLDVVREVVERLVEHLHVTRREEMVDGVRVPRVLVGPGRVDEVDVVRAGLGELDVKAPSGSSVKWSVWVRTEKVISDGYGPQMSSGAINENVTLWSTAVFFFDGRAAAAADQAESHQTGENGGADRTVDHLVHAELLSCRTPHPEGVHPPADPFIRG